MILTYLLTPWCRVLLEKPTGFAASQEIPRIISWVVLLWFHVCWCYVVVWLGWYGIRMQAEALVCFIISLFNAQHVSDVNTSILRSLRLIC